VKTLLVPSSYCTALTFDLASESGLLTRNVLIRIFFPDAVFKNLNSWTCSIVPVRIFRTTAQIQYHTSRHPTFQVSTHGGIDLRCLERCGFHGIFRSFSLNISKNHPAVTAPDSRVRMPRVSDTSHLDLSIRDLVGHWVLI
jgi:hypothetical protein